MSTTKKTKKTRSETSAERFVSGECPACRLKTRLHAESLGIGADVLCSECSAILRIVGTNPLQFAEVEEEEEQEDGVQL
jgi:ribosomal protein S27E